MRTWALMLGCALAAAPAAGQGLRAPAAPGDAPIKVTTRARHVSTVVLPETAEIIEVVAGDPERWDVSAAAHLVFVRPLAPGARSNVVLLTATGDDRAASLVVESADAAVDAVVRVGISEAQPREAPGEPVLASTEAVEAAMARAGGRDVGRPWLRQRRGRPTRVEAARVAALEQRLDENRAGVSPAVAVRLPLAG